MADKKKDKFCIRCSRKAEDGDKYCVGCGAPLVNSCTNAGDMFTKKCTRVNREDAAFCSGCGAETVFHREGLIAGTSMRTERKGDRP